MTMTELARRLGVSISLVSIWERGKAPIPSDRLKEIKKVCNFEEEIPARDETFVVSAEGSPAIKIEAPEVRMCQTVELGPETMKALKDLIDTAVQQIKHPSLTPEVIEAAREGDRYRAKTQEVLGRGW